MLGKRLATAIALIAILLLSLFLPWNTFPIFVIFVAALGAWEWATLADIQQQKWRLMYTGIVVALVVLIAVSQQALISAAYGIAFLVFWFWILLIPLLVKYPSTAPLFKYRPFAIGISILILLSAAAGLLWLRVQENGAWLVLILIMIVTFADSGAYFAGKAFGKTSLAPNISPGKTFEGLYGGLCANFLFALLLCLFLTPSIEQSFGLVFVILGTSLFSVAGDLLESAIKRSRGVKDSGNILPGHGGVLDRIDGLCAAVPCFVFGMLLLEI